MLQINEDCKSILSSTTVRILHHLKNDVNVGVGLDREQHIRKFRASLKSRFSSTCYAVGTELLLYVKSFLDAGSFSSSCHSPLATPACLILAC